VTNNDIHDVDYSGGRPAGVYVLGDGQKIQDNTITSVGRGGIESNSGLLTPAAVLTNADISMNDISSFGMLEQDDGAIYTCCSLNMSGTNIHHNWLHDAHTYAGVPQRATIGVYIDGGSNGGGSGLNIYDNVGWNIDNGTVGLVSSNPVINTRVLNNDGGVFLLGISSWDSSSHIDNNIGQIAEVTISTTVAPTINMTANLGDVNVTDPMYTDEAARNYTLKPGSPAIGTGVSDPPGTNDYTGTGSPNMGAYQPNTPWVPGASGQPAAPIRPQWGASSLTATGSWIWPIGGAEPIGRMDSHPSNPYADKWPGFPGTDDASLHFTFTTPASNNHTIDRVYVLFYARMHRNLPTTGGNVVLTMPSIGTVFDAHGADFDDVGVPYKLDITSQVGGSWPNLPTSADLAITGFGPEPQAGPAGPYAGIDIYAVEIDVEAH